MPTQPLNCPSCNGILEVFHYKQVEVDVCSSCHGIWCDFGELKSLADSDTLTNIDQAFQGDYIKQAVQQTNGEIHGPNRNCPVDGTLLERHEWAWDSNIVLDFCNHCFGTWLDPGELEGYVAKQQKQKEDVDALRNHPAIRQAVKENERWETELEQLKTASPAIPINFISSFLEGAISLFRN